MANPYFAFKQFTVFHDRCAMKVGTDGVLLGAWADVSGSRRMLDVGTGSGLIALMLAQRNPNVQVLAIDMDKDAVEQARENVRKSPFASRITVENISYQLFANEDCGYFDHIVSNPPFFASSLLSPDGRRSAARHEVSLDLEQLLDISRRILAPFGRISLILPFDAITKLQRLSERFGYFLVRETRVLPMPESSPKRILIELSMEPVLDPVRSELVIEQRRQAYTDEFSELVKDFYLYL